MNLVSLAVFLRILVHETSAKYEDPATLFCPAHQPCTTAFASQNPITLKCQDQPGNTAVYWQYVDVLLPHSRKVIFREGSNLKDEDLNSEEHMKVLDMTSRSEVTSGNLRLLSPHVQDTGIYTCQQEGLYLAYYEIEFQDAENIYISHSSLGQSVQPNTTIDLGKVGTVEVYTVWGDWQPCDRCGTLGERKKLGFCYSKVTRDSAVIVGPRPCGLLPPNFSQIQFNHPPELRIETCKASCTEMASTENEDLIMVLANYHTYLHADATFKCLSSSIYKPVYWEHENTSFTRLQQMMNNASYVLDKTTGGGTLFIPILNRSDKGLYKCYVDRRLLGRFIVTFPDIVYPAEPRHYSTAESVGIGLSIFLFILLLLALFQSCINTTTSSAGTHF